MIFLVLILLFIVHVFCLCIVVIVFQDTSSRCIVWWQTFKLNSVAQTTLKVQLTISNISSEYWWSQIYQPHYTCWNSRLTSRYASLTWQSPWLTENCDVRPISHFCDVFSDLLLRLSACLCEFIFSYEKLHFPARFASDQSNISSRHLSFLKSTILYHQSRRGLKDFLRPSSCFGSLGC